MKGYIAKIEESDKQYAHIESQMRELARLSAFLVECVCMQAALCNGEDVAQKPESKEVQTVARRASNLKQRPSGGDLSFLGGTRRGPTVRYRNSDIPKGELVSMIKTLQVGCMRIMRETELFRNNKLGERRVFDELMRREERGAKKESVGAVLPELKKMRGSEEVNFG